LELDGEMGIFAKDLVKYTYYTAGFKLTPASFSHLIPVEFYTTTINKDLGVNDLTFNDFLTKQFETAKDSPTMYAGFISRFFRNNSEVGAFVPKVDKKFKNITGSIGMMRGKPAYFMVNSRDMNTTSDFVLSSNKKETKFIEYVSYKHKGNVYLYRKVDQKVDAHSGIYVLAEKLGIHNEALEYVKDNLDSVVSGNNPYQGFTEAETVTKALTLIKTDKVMIKEEGIQQELPMEIDTTKQSPIQPSFKPIKRMDELTNHSGGALGADSVWDSVGRLFNVTNHKHYYAGSKTPKGNIKLTDSQLKEGIAHARKAGETLGKTPRKQSTLDLLGRNWFQVKNADAVYAVAPLETPKSMIVEGGTGWAVQMALDVNKPVFVFDTKTNKWFILNKSLSERPIELEEAPLLTRNFAGIGSRNITETGKQAIHAAYKATQEGLKGTTQQPTINVYWGASESNTNTKILSNLAPRKFKHEDFDGVTREYQSVEHAYQTLKNGSVNIDVYNRPQDFVGTKRNAPRLTEKGKRGNVQLMKELVVESFVQNPNSDASKKLLQYGSFTHKQGKTPVSDKAFLEGLNQARAELQTIKPTKELSKTKQDLLESYDLIKEDMEAIGIAKENIPALTDEEAGVLIKKFCK